MCRPVCRSLRVWVVVASACAGGLCPIARSLARPNDDPFAEATAASRASEEPPEVRIERGRELFLKRWKVADVANPTGDGLGPVYNGRSCVECHGMSRPGGAGETDHNVDLLSVVAQTSATHDRRRFLAKLTAIDAAFTAESPSGLSSVTLHKFGSDPAYATWRLGVLAIVAKTHSAANETQQPAKPTANEISMRLLRESNKPHSSSNRSAREAGDDARPARPDRLVLVVAHRSTPALFGAGLIDGISDQVLQAEAKAQAARRNLIRGQVAMAGGGRAGKFGWRGQTATLKDFVMGACANEIGLQVPGHNQGIDPLDPAYRAPGLDLTQDQCDELTEFVASLPRPEQRQAKNVDELEQWQTGERVFETVGCANCHVRTLGNVDGLYSDLLLHDLGPSLSDPVGAPSSSSDSSRPFGSGGYNGGQQSMFVSVPDSGRRQWRTTPLWGVADSAPYLHDGRAATLEEAIVAHGGEAAMSARFFAGLPTADRDRLLAFLGSLAAPEETDRVAKD